MISPLNIHIVEIHQLLHNDIRPRPSVKNIPYNVQIVDREVLNQMAQSPDKLVPYPRADHRVNDLIIVQLFIFIIVIHMEQFVDGIGEFLRHLFSHFGAGILGRHLPADLHQTVDRYLLPVLRVGSLLLETRQIPFRIIDQVRNPYLFILGNQVPESRLNFLPGNSGG